MKALSDRTLDELEETALVGAKAVREYLSYKGENPDYHRRAKIGVAAITGFARTRQSESGRMAIELQAGRVIELPAPKKELRAAK